MRRFALPLLLTLALAVPAAATPITGSVSFGGALEATDFLTTNVLDVENDTAVVLCAVLTNCAGSYGALSGLIFAQHGDITIAPFVAGQLWSFLDGGLTYSFDLNSIDSVIRGPNGIILTGTGTAHITGLDSTAAQWSFSANNVDRFVFSSTTAVPEPMILSLFGLGLAGVAYRRRQRR